MTVSSELAHLLHVATIDITNSGVVPRPLYEDKIPCRICVQTITEK